MNSILVIRLTSLGDVLLTSPVIRALKNAYPAARVDVAVDSRYAEVWNDNPHIGNVVALEKGQEHNVRFAAYDLVIDVQRNRRSAAIVRAVSRVSKPIVVRYRKHRIEKLAMVYLKRKPRALSHIVQRYLEPLRRLGIAVDSGGLELWPLPAQHPAVGQDVHPMRPRIGVAPGAQHFTKRYPQ